MSDQDRRLQLARACRHRRAHYLDENGNRQCFCCDAFIRPIDGVPVIDAPLMPV